MVHQDVQVKDVYFQPRLDGAKVELTLENQSGSTREVVPALDFVSRQTGAIMTPKAASPAVTLRAGETTTVTLDTGS